MKKFLSLFLILGMMFSLVGCGSEDEANAKEKTEQKEEKKEDLSFGSTVEFEGCEITFNEPAEFIVFDNEFSDLHGSEIVKVPVTVKNVSDEVSGINMFYVKVYGSQGVQVDDVSTYYMEDDMLFTAGTDSLQPGAQINTFFHFVYDGNGEYIIKLEAFDGATNIKLPINK